MAQPHTEGLAVPFARVSLDKRLIIRPFRRGHPSSEEMKIDCVCKKRVWGRLVSAILPCFSPAINRVNRTLSADNAGDPRYCAVV